MNWYKRATASYPKAVIFASVAVVIGTATVIASLATTDQDKPQPTPQLSAQARQYVNQGYKPAGCNVIKPGQHHCNLVVPVNTKGQAIAAHSFQAATRLRHDTSAHTPHVSGVSLSSYSPQQFHTAYQLPCTPGGPVQGTCSQPSSFGPETIAVVDPGSYQGPGTVESSLATYDQQYGLPSCTQANGCLSIVNQNGQTSPLPSPLPSSDNWDAEFDLDVQTAHMICQTCKIILVESTDDGESLDQAVSTAASLKPTAISLSWGGANEPADNSDFEFKGIAVVGSTGDSGSDEAQGYPGDLADVIDAAGTTLTLNSDNTWKSETVWSDSGGGCALSGFSAPTWQTSLSNWSTAGCGKLKGDGDLSVDADPNPGVAEYSDGQWTYVGGTSLSSPLIASALALGGGIPGTEYGSQFVYQNATSADTHDITQGNDCTSSVTTHCTAAAGFDEPSGLGSINGLALFGASQPTAPANVHAASFNQNSVSLAWTASTSSGVTGYTIYRNGSSVGTTASTSYTDTGLSANTAYSYTVAANGGNNTISPQSPAVSVTTWYPADINEDKHVNVTDLSILLSDWGQSAASAGRADINGDGTVNVFDLSILLGEFGSE